MRGYNDITELWLIVIVVDRQVLFIGMGWLNLARNPVLQPRQTFYSDAAVNKTTNDGRRRSSSSTIPELYTYGQISARHIFDERWKQFRNSNPTNIQFKLAKLLKLIASPESPDASQWCLYFLKRAVLQHLQQQGLCSNRQVPNTTYYLHQTPDLAVHRPHCIAGKTSQLLVSWVQHYHGAPRGAPST